MAAIVAEQSLMADGTLKAKVVLAALRFAAWVLPPHRKEWTEAMLNEAAYIESPRHALRWIFGSVLSSMKARASYEMERAFMSHRILKTFITLSVLAVATLIGVYAVQKPYQRERIKLVILHQVEPSSTPPATI